MVQALKKKFKNEKGFTLIELLAVIVILGILAAIAIPSVIGIIDNSKKDAHVANAQQMVSAAKMAVANNSELQTGTKYLPLEYLVDAKYLDPVNDPDSGSYKPTSTSNGGNNTLAKVKNLGQPTAGSYVTVDNGVVTKVKLINNSRGIRETTENVIDVNKLTRDNVIAN